MHVPRMMRVMPLTIPAAYRGPDPAHTLNQALPSSPTNH
jgi:hypothetical protein